MIIVMQKGTTARQLKSVKEAGGPTLHGPQSLKPTRFAGMMEKLREFAHVAGKEL